MKYTKTVIFFFLCLMGKFPLLASSSCCQCPQNGQRGPTGLQGPQGPQGPDCLGVVASISSQVDQTIADGDPLIFDMVNAISDGITIIGASNAISGLVLENPGFYCVSYGFTADTPGSNNNRQFLLRLNGTDDIPGSQMDSQESIMQDISVIFEVTSPNSTLELLNNSGFAVPIGTSTFTSVSAFLAIKQLE